MVKIKGNKVAPPAKREAEEEAVPNTKRSKPAEASEEEDGAGLAGLLGNHKVPKNFVASIAVIAMRRC